MIARNKRMVRAVNRMESTLSGRNHRNIVCVLLSYRTFSQTWAFHPNWGADLFAGVRSVIGTAARRGMGAYHAIQQTLCGQAATYPG